MNEKNGTDYYIEVDLITDPNTNEFPPTDENYRLVACAISNGFSMTVADQNTSNKCSGGWNESIGGEGDFNFNLDGQAVALSELEEDIKTNYQALAQACLDKKTFFTRMTGITKDIYREGKTRINQYEETAPNQDAYTFTSTFKGIGKPRIEAPTT